MYVFVFVLYWLECSLTEILIRFDATLQYLLYCLMYYTVIKTRTAINIVKYVFLFVGASRH